MPLQRGIVLAVFCRSATLLQRNTDIILLIAQHLVIAFAFPFLNYVYIYSYQPPHTFLTLKKISCFVSEMCSILRNMGTKDVTVTQTITAEEYETTMSEIAESPPDGGAAEFLPRRELSRSDVVYAFQACFDNIGGVPRMAVWAEENPGDFFKLYARLLPRGALDD